MIFNLIITIVSFLFVSVSAKTGFVKLVDTKLEKSIFKVFVPAGTYKSYKKIDPVLKKQLEVEFRDKHSDWKTYQLAFCQAHPDQTCLIFDNMVEGTIFIAGKNDQMYSNLHVFKRYIFGMTKSDENFDKNYVDQITKIAIPFVLRNASGSQIYNGLANEFATVTTITTLKSVLNPANERLLKSEVTDIIAFHFPTPMGTALESSSEFDTSVKKEICIVGFPAKTTDRAARNLNDSDGISFYKSCGQTMFAKEQSQKSGKNADISSGLQEILDSIFLFSDADAAEGNSGGPMLDSNDKVVGILSTLAKSLKDQSVISSGINYLNLEDTIAHWPMFKD